MKDVKQEHHRAEKLREKELYFEALELYEKVIVSYLQNNNFGGVAEALQGKVLTYKHLYLTTGEEVYAILGKQTAKMSLRIIESENIEEMKWSAYFSMGRVSNMVGDLSETAGYYQKALEHHRKDNASHGDLQSHLGGAQYQSGDKIRGEKNLWAGLKQIERFEGQMDEFVFDVWRSGALMTIAGCLWSDKRKDAEVCLEKARKIINENQALVIRKRQLEELEEKLKGADK